MEGKSLRDDDAFAAFFAEPFDAAAFSSSLIEADTDGAYLARLNGGIARLERDASAEVTANHDELIALDGHYARMTRHAAAS